jgi:hypothetical protein
LVALFGSFGLLRLPLGRPRLRGWSSNMSSSLFIPSRPWYASSAAIPSSSLSPRRLQNSTKVSVASLPTPHIVTYFRFDFVLGGDALGSGGLPRGRGPVDGVAAGLLTSCRTARFLLPSTRLYHSWAWARSSSSNISSFIDIRKSNFMQMVRSRSGRLPLPQNTATVKPNTNTNTIQFSPSIQI